jgi:hypothetical protein
VERPEIKQTSPVQFHEFLNLQNQILQEERSYRKWPRRLQTLLFLSKFLSVKLKTSNFNSEKIYNPKINIVK